MSAFQILPTLSKEDYSGLRASIAKYGVQVAVEYDECGNIIDGHHRVRICEELGIKDWPKIVRRLADDDAKRTQARELNFRRRHMGRDVLRAMIAEELRENPVRSNRQIATDVGVHHTTVSTMRNEMEDGGEISHHLERVGKDGISQPAKKRAKVKEDHEPDLVAEPQRKRAGVPAPWVKIKLPDGETIADVARRGIELERDGETVDGIARTLGLGNATYQCARDIVQIAERPDLRRSDRAIARAALDEMNQSSQIKRAWELISPVVDRLWGGQIGKRDAIERRRKDMFDKAFGALVQICSTADKIEIPYFTPEQAAEALAELAAAEKAVREFKAKLKELTSD